MRWRDSIRIHAEMRKSVLSPIDPYILLHCLIILAFTCNWIYQHGGKQQFLTSYPYLRWLVHKAGETLPPKSPFPLPSLAGLSWHNKASSLLFFPPVARRRVLSSAFPTHPISPVSFRNSMINKSSIDLKEWYLLIATASKRGLKSNQLSFLPNPLPIWPG